MKLKPSLIIGITLVIFGALSLIKIKPKYDNLIDIDTPSAETIALVSPAASLVIDPNDKAKLALFNYEFAKRVVGYDTDVQQLNDVYVLAAIKFFQNSILNKYSGLGSKIKELIAHTTTEDNHILEQSEKNALSNNFMGLAYHLINK